MSKSIVHIFGGMGNQMFQYVFYLKLKAEGKEAFINIDFFTYKYSKREHAQKYILRDAFVNIDAPVFSNYMSKVIYSNQIQWRVYKIIRKLFYMKKRVVQTLDFVTSQNIEKINPRKKTLHYRDYWIDTKHFFGIEEVVRSAFSFNIENVTGQNRALIKEMAKHESVSIHVRRGDYLSEPFLSKFCQPDYYEKAIKIIEKNILLPIIIFSPTILNGAKIISGIWAQHRLSIGIPVNAATSI